MDRPLAGYRRGRWDPGREGEDERDAGESCFHDAWCLRVPITYWEEKSASFSAIRLKGVVRIVTFARARLHKSSARTEPTHRPMGTIDETVPSASLATLRTTTFERTVAAAMAILAYAIAAVALPHLSVPWPVVPAFLASFGAAIVLADGIVAFLLLRHATVTRSPLLALFGAAYAYSSAIVIPHILSFPPVFTERGLVGGGSQTTVWLWVAWHAGFPAFIVAALAVDRLGPRIGWSGTRRLAIICGIVPPLLAAAISWAIIATGDRLPRLIVNGDYHGLMASGLGPGIEVLCLVTLVGLVVRGRSQRVALLWLSVSLFAFAFVGRRALPRRRQALQRRLVCRPRGLADRFHRRPFRSLASFRAHHRAARARRAAGRRGARSRDPRRARAS